MTLEEFISYCALKDCIVTDERQTYYHNRYKLIVKYNNVVAKICYSKLEDGYQIIYCYMSELDSKSPNSFYYSDLETVIKHFT